LVILGYLGHKSTITVLYINFREGLGYTCLQVTLSFGAFAYNSICIHLQATKKN